MVVVLASGGVLSLAVDGVLEAWSSFAAWMMTPVGDSAESGSTITVRVV
jgi:hypothetical protein